MTPTTEDSLKKHLDAVDRLERKFKFTMVFAGVVTVCMYGSFFYLSAKGEDIRMVLTFHLLAITMQIALVLQTAHRSMAQMTNTILKAIELAARDSQR